MSASRSRQKRKLEPISLEELAGATGMSGFCTFLTRDAQTPVPALDQLGTGAPESAALESGPPEPDPVVPASIKSGAVVPGVADMSGIAADAHSIDSSALEMPAAASGADSGGALAEDAPSALPLQVVTPISRASIGTALDSRYGGVSSAPESHALNSGASQSDAVGFRYRRRPRIREANTVQDGHSLAEQAVYDTMYGAGKPYKEESRILTIGLRTLAELSRMAYSNCKLNVRSLIAKKAIDELPGFSYTDGRTYIVHSPREILRRRKEAGLTHVLRTRGVAFVAPDASASMADAVEMSAPDSDAPGLRAPYLESSAPESIVEALRRQDPAADEATAGILWQRCRDVEPSATAEEVVQFIHLKGGQPLGVLLSVVPRCFQGAAFRQFREWARSAFEPR